ncbi:MAG: DUF2510 domain-containing protein [Acidimicrobiaceae bacterium]|nr:DUF2510 domain-containing protein [Acidimicrobiaceae bacterium]MCY4280450.1 DUF2510 domain-containing protein [Acidimicrobiaceae bacterium]MCY4295217.1 DUF2510 domain-containing protein [Acidimicrobiaceae bacterium]
MSDLPPADWYVDPEDSTQYRYWDGLAWTEHRSARYSDATSGGDDDGAGMRGAWQLVAKSFSTAVRHWRACALAGLITGVGYAAVAVLALVSANAMLDGGVEGLLDRLEDLEELSDIQERLDDIDSNEAAFFLPDERDRIGGQLAEINANTGIYSTGELDEIQRQLDRIDAAGAEGFAAGDLADVQERLKDYRFLDAVGPIDWSPVKLLPLTLGLLIVWVAVNLAKAMVTRLATADLAGRKRRLRDLINKSLSRVPRLMGLDVRIFGLFVAAGFVMMASALFLSPWLLLVTIPGWIALTVYALPVLSLAYVVAASGSSTRSLSYAVRLVRQRFWKCLGRLLLVILVSVAVSTVVSIVLESATGSLPASPFAATAVSILLGIVATIAPAILYRDLGGEFDSDHEHDPSGSDPDGETELGAWVS